MGQAMSDTIFSFVFDRRRALAVFPGVAIDQFLVAILARIPPSAAWEGCLVYTGATPLDPETTVCVVTRGPGADEAQRSLAEQFEALEIPVLAVYEGGPEQASLLARVGGGRWCQI
jgi:hypothetical protein